MSKKALDKLRSLANPEQAKFAAGFFRTHPGGYGEGDRFLGLSVPVIRALSRECRDLPDVDLSRLLKSEWHEARLLGLIVLTDRAKRSLQLAKKNRKQSRQEIEKHFLFFKKHLKHVNNWDLVDVSVAWVVGSYFFKRDDRERQKWLKSASLWERRIGYVSLLYDARQSHLDRIFEYGTWLLDDKEDLMHKALGWVLREGGKRDATRLRQFLKKYGQRMPRTALRYAIEKFPEVERKRWVQSTRAF